MQNVIPIPLRFKTLGRSYAQIGRKGNIALYAAYSDYWNDRKYSIPYVLLGFELIAIKIFKGKERYPRPEQFGHSAWSIPKSFFRFCRTCTRFCSSRLEEFRRTLLTSFLDRPANSAEFAHLAA